MSENLKEASALLFQMSHDIRTGVSTIVGFSETAKKNRDNPEKLDDCLEKITVSSHALLENVNNVLSLIRIHTGSFVFDEEKTDIEDFVIEFEETHRDRLRAVSQKLVVREENIGHRIVMMDGRCIGYALGAVVSRLSELAGPGAVVVFTVREEAGAYHFTASVNSLYIPAEETAQAFGVSGAGAYAAEKLPMIIAHEIIALSGGSIDVTSSRESGTAADIVLPLKVMNEFTRFRSAFGNELNRKALAGKRVLAVDDNELNREIMCDFLDEYGMIYEEAANGAEAVAKVADNPAGYFDYVLMDVSMPVMDGYEATRQIRKDWNNKALPIIAITANVSTEDKNACLEAGMNAYLPKPLDRERLINTMLLVGDK